MDDIRRTVKYIRKLFTCKYVTTKNCRLRDSVVKCAILCNHGYLLLLFHKGLPRYDSGLCYDETLGVVYNWIFIWVLWYFRARVYNSGRFGDLPYVVCCV
jgi:hypothetical protein